MPSTTTVHRQSSNFALSCVGCTDLIDNNLFSLEFEKFEDGTSEFRRYHRRCYEAKYGVKV